MIKVYKKFILLLLVIILASCNTISDDDFIYLGHGESSPDYQLYYDKTKQLFLLIDKKNGCFQKDDTGTCLAFTLKQANEFRENVLAKMIAINERLAKDNYGDYALKELQKAGITTVKKLIKTKKVYATPVKQIFLDRKQQYILVRNQYALHSKLVAMVIDGNDGKKHIKVAYIVYIPDLKKKFNTNLRPFIIDPEYLYNHMTMDSVNKAQSLQKDVIKNKK
ncbi:MAG: hypothetical protein Kow0076_1110 [Francisella sp.]